jgi:RNA-binding protein YhbY
MAEPLTDYIITEHAAFEIGRRGLTEEVVRRIISAPEQRYQVRPGRMFFKAARP